MAGSVRERSPGRWELRVFVGKDPLTGKKKWATKTVSAMGKRSAQRQADRWSVDLEKNPRHDSPSTFGELLDQWTSNNERSWSPSTVKEHRRICTKKLAGLRDERVDKITTHTLDELYASLAKGGGKEGRPLSTSTVNRIHVVVRAALQQALVWGWIGTNPAEHANPGRIIEEEDCDLPSDATRIVQLLADADEYDERGMLSLFLLLAITTGARRGALCALRWKDIDLEHGSIRFPRAIVIGPHGPVERPARKVKRSGRNIALDPYTVAALKAHLKNRKEHVLVNGFLFSDDATGQVPWRPDSTSRKFRFIRGDLDIRLHDLRDLMATTLLSRGINPKVVAERGGWKKVATMLERYAHALPPQDRAAAEIIGTWLTA